LSPSTKAAEDDFFQMLSSKKFQPLYISEEKIVIVSKKLVVLNRKKTLTRICNRSNLQSDQITSSTVETRLPIDSSTQHEGKTLFAKGPTK